MRLRPDRPRNSPSCGAVLALSLLSAGCASRAIPVEGASSAFDPPTPAKHAAVLEEMMPWARLEGGTPTSLERRDDDGAWVTRYEVLEGPHAGSIMSLRREADASAGSWTIVRRVEGQPDPIETDALRIDTSSGSLLIPYLVNHERGVRVEMQPPGLAFPARIEPWESLTLDMKMRLPYISQPRKLRERGTGRAELRLVGAQRVHTRAGVFDALHLREVFESRLSAATAVRTIDRWFAAGAGLIAETWNEEVRVLGVVVERTSHAMMVLPPSGDG